MTKQEVLDYLFKIESECEKSIQKEKQLTPKIWNNAIFNLGYRIGKISLSREIHQRDSLLPPYINLY